MIVEVHFKIDFMRINPLRHQDMNPPPFNLRLPATALPSIKWISISRIDPISPIGNLYSAELISGQDKPLL